MGANHFFSGVEVESEILNFWQIVKEVCESIKLNSYIERKSQFSTEFFRERPNQSNLDILIKVEKATIWLQRALEKDYSELKSLVAFIQSSHVWSSYLYKYIQSCPSNPKQMESDLEQIRIKASNLVMQKQHKAHVGSVKRLTFVYFIHKDVNCASAMLANLKDYNTSDLRINFAGAIGAKAKMARVNNAEKVKPKPVPVIAEGAEVRIRARARARA